MTQQIIKGMDALRSLIEGKRFFLIRGGSYDRLPVKCVLEGLAHTEFSAFTPNPEYEQVAFGVKLFRESGCEMIVAVGGGSAMDVAKCIKLFCKMDSGVHYLRQEQKDTGIPVVAVPTTAGSGSESTQHAVIYCNGVKQSISHHSILPDYAILEHSVLRYLPVYQKKCTMMDALCQGIESWWSVNSNDESKGYSRIAVETIKMYWKEYIEGRTDEAAEKMMEAANYAGRAINITATTAPHAMSYKLTSMYKLPHGHAVAICLPEVWEYMLQNMTKCIDVRGCNYLSNIFLDIPVDVKWFRQLIRGLDLTCPTSKSRAEDIAVLGGSVNPVRLKNNPVALDAETLKNMYERIVR